MESLLEILRKYEVDAFDWIGFSCQEEKREVEELAHPPEISPKVEDLVLVSYAAQPDCIYSEYFIGCRK